MFMARKSAYLQCDPHLKVSREEIDTAGAFRNHAAEPEVNIFRTPNCICRPDGGEKSKRERGKAVHE